MYSNVIFDLYGTLVDISTNESSPALWRNLAKIYTTFGAHYTSKELHQSYDRLCLQETEKFTYPNPEICLDHVFRNLYAEKGILADDTLVWYTGNTFRALSRSKLHVFPGIYELLQSLKENGQKVFLLSNAQRIFTWQELSICRLFPYFDGIFISSDHGYKKPDVRYLELLLNTYQLSVEDCIMVGNELKSDIAIANAIGMDSLYLRTADYEKLPDRIPSTYQILDGSISKMSQILLP